MNTCSGPYKSFLAFSKSLTSYFSVMKATLFILGLFSAPALARSVDNLEEELHRVSVEEPCTPHMAFVEKHVCQDFNCLNAWNTSASALAYSQRVSLS